MDPPPQKSQPWKDLISTTNPSSTSITGLTDRPWIREQLANSYEDKLRGERQGRYAEYDEYRRADPFKFLYKAEGRSKTNPGKVEVPGDELAAGMDVGELKRKLELVKGDTTR